MGTAGTIPGPVLAYDTIPMGWIGSEHPQAIGYLSLSPPNKQSSVSTDIACPSTPFAVFLRQRNIAGS